MMEEGNGRTARGRDGPFPPPVAVVMAGHGGAIEHPTPYDVLSGRGSMVNNHPGNIRYRELCNAVKAEYLSPETRKMHKSHISARIVRAVRDGPNPGRFLKRDGRTGRWYDVGDRVAFRKTGQALREKAPQFRMVRGQGGQSGQSADGDGDAPPALPPPRGPPPPAPRTAPLAHHPAAHPPPAHPSAYPAGHPGHPGLAFASAAPPSAGADAARRVATPHPGAVEDGRKPAPEESAGRGADGPASGHPGR